MDDDEDTRGAQWDGRARRRDVALDDTTTPVPALLRDLRARLHLSQRDLASCALVAPDTVRRAENGEDIRVSVLRRLLAVGREELTSLRRAGLPDSQREQQAARLRAHLSRGATSRLEAALAALDPSGDLRAEVVASAVPPGWGPGTPPARDRDRGSTPSAVAAGSRVAAGPLVRHLWTGGDGTPEPVAPGAWYVAWSSTVPGDVVHVVLPGTEGPHRPSAPHVRVPVLTPAAAAGRATDAAVVRPMLAAARLLGVGASGDRSDRRPVPYRLPDRVRRLAAEWQDDPFRWRPADDPCDGPEHRLGPARGSREEEEQTARAAASEARRRSRTHAAGPLDP